MKCKKSELHTGKELTLILIRPKTLFKQTFISVICMQLTEYKIFTPFYVTDIADSEYTYNVSGKNVDLYV